MRKILMMLALTVASPRNICQGSRGPSELAVLGDLDSSKIQQCTNNLHLCQAEKKKLNQEIKKMEERLSLLPVGNTKKEEGKNGEHEIERLRQQDKDATFRNELQLELSQETISSLSTQLQEAEKIAHQLQEAEKIARQQALNKELLELQATEIAYYTAGFNLMTENEQELKQTLAKQDESLKELRAKNEELKKEIEGLKQKH